MQLSVEHLHRETFFWHKQQFFCNNCYLDKNVICDSCFGPVKLKENKDCDVAEMAEGECKVWDGRWGRCVGEDEVGVKRQERTDGHRATGPFNKIMVLNLLDNEIYNEHKERLSKNADILFKLDVLISRLKEYYPEAEIFVDLVNPTQKIKFSKWL